LLSAPPNLGGFTQAVRDLSELAAIGRKLWQADGLEAAFQLFRKSAGDMLDGWFESDPIKAVLGFDAVIGNLASLYAAGSAYMLLHHAFGEVNGKSGVWGYAIGGMGAITQAIANAAAEHGVRIDVCSEVREVLVEGDRATGIVLKDGTAVRARAVIANVNPQYLFQTLVPRDAAPHAVAARMTAWKAGSGTFRMNVALSKLPSFSALPVPGDHHTAGIILAPSLSYMEQAYRDCVRCGWSRMPIIEIVIPSTLDDRLAPTGLPAFCQNLPAFPPE
jgi:phytoene dehydrogenase-like protein